MLQVGIEAHATPSERAAVEAVFQAEGVDAVVKANYFMKSVDPPAINMLEGVLTVFLGHFLAKAAEATYERAAPVAGRRLRAFLDHLRAARPKRRASGGILFEDADRRVQIFIPDDLPDEGYVELFGFDFEHLTPSASPRFDIVQYDRQSHSWQFFMPEDPTRALPRK